MAPTKRLRANSDEGETEVLEVESARSDPQQAARKRLRTSYDSADGSSSVESSDSERYVEQGTQFATQQKEKAKTRAQHGAADNGIIESITCNNFMCHSNLFVPLGPLINFIVGQNGSGKSAVLTALTICLGGKASSTNRGQSLKSFIKEGEESAMLSVKIKNEGESAYQHDTYGDAIIVERHFSRSGSSAFRLKNCAGKVMSTKKGDLEEICDYFALQIDNPMNVLTQDMARQFLSASSPQEKYKYFMKGTQLEHLDCDYLIVEQTLDTIDTELYKKIEDSTVFEEQARKAEELFRQSSQQDVLSQKLKQLRDQMAWVQVECEEKKLASQDERLRSLDEEVARLEERANGLDEAFKQTDQHVENARNSLAGAQDILKPLQDDKASIKAAHDKDKTEQTSIQTEERSIVCELKGAKNRVKTLEGDIKTEQRRLAEADGGKSAERRLELEGRQGKAAEAKQRHQQHEQELSQLQDKEKEAKNAVSEAQDVAREKHAILKTAEDKLTALRRDRGQQLNAYPASMSQLLKAIQQDGTFREQPIGPIGNHVRLLQPSWSSILEKQFGSALDSFIVTSKEDQNKLATLMQSCSCNSPILISSKNRLDTSQHEPAPEFETWLRVLEIDNDSARNSMIISQGIDQTILIADRKEALSTMNGDRLRNVRQCFTHNTHRSEGIRFGYGFGGGLSESYIPAFKGTPRMKTDIDYQINSQNQILQEAKRAFSDAEAQTRERQAHVQQCQKTITDHTKASNEMKIESQQAQSLVEQLQDALDEDAVEEGRLDALKAQLAEAEEEVSITENSYQEAINAKDAMYKRLGETRKKMQDLDVKITAAETNVKKAEGKVNQRSDERTARLREKNAALDEVERVKLTKVPMLQSRTEQQEIVVDFTQQALEICDRVPIDEGETEPSLNKKHTKLEQDLKRSREKVGDRQVIARNVQKAVAVRDRARKEIEGIERLVHLLKTTLVGRKERWTQFRRLITARARNQFFYLLSERGFRGKLIMDYKHKMLDLRVEPDETRRSGSGRATHGLSGGEKSFSTICLLLSIWEAMGAPIRCLDEFDVFMDNVNRDISMQMMIQFASDSPGKQFVLISPQQPGSYLRGKYIKIHQMVPPNRGQALLSYPVAAA